ncbi:plasmid pRiA4b ORF-3 family protein [Flavobacterium sp. SM15]|uniref:plasmid pRiA4b ORF-3 family protein n=1 Tax=Flavobacterium sp. SM15 TaxID=2908005 RepID=UPI001EDC2440|nr:plasmid pRiA4b ORF-3 family protein [Flavobacterium sp. SM15]MCG2611062.1 plasmid pRiA4b ORF-3 family protein [Flavobacterium sp. SM15]
MVYKFRVILDAEEDIFRDIAILEDDNLEDLHNAIVNAFGFDGMEIASFYTCDDAWTQEEEIPLFDTGDVAGEMKTMADYPLSSILNEDDTKIIYVYDFLNMWTFFVELAAIEEEEPGVTYPDLLFAHGELPTDAPTKDFNSPNVSKDDIYGDFEDDFDEEDFDMFDGDDSFEDMGYEDNWN